MKQLMGEHGPANPQIGFIDGYHLAERLLEGVSFQVQPDASSSKLICVGYDPQHSSYMKKFSKEQISEWCEKAAHYAMENECQNSTNTEDLYWDDVESGDSDA